MNSYFREGVQKQQASPHLYNFVDSPSLREGIEYTFFIPGKVKTSRRENFCSDTGKTRPNQISDFIFPENWKPSVFPPKKKHELFWIIQ